MISYNRSNFALPGVLATKTSEYEPKMDEFTGNSVNFTRLPLRVKFSSIFYM